MGGAVTMGAASTQAPTAGQQAALLPELQRPAQPTVLPRVGLWGVLAEDARHFTSINGQTHLQVLVAQHVPGRPEACPVLATLHYPDTGTPHVTAQLASRAAAALRRGAEVMVTGEGLHPWHHNGQPAMALGRTQSIRPIDEHIAPPHHSQTGDH